MWKLFQRKKKHYGEIAPEDIFLDASNIPEFNRDQMEGRIETPIPRLYLMVLGITCGCMITFLAYRAFALQIVEGERYAKQSKENSLRNEILFASRGLITDRHGVLLAWNEPNEKATEFPWRRYIEADGFGNLLGYVKYPARDKGGFYYKTNISGADGVELFYESLLAGVNGLKIVEEDVGGRVQSESTIRPPDEGKNVVLSIDAEVQRVLYNTIKQTVETAGFVGGGGIIMDVHTGEVLAVTTYPEFDSAVMTDGNDRNVISGYFEDKRNPFLDRAITGLYAPGSIIKPFMSIAAFNEGVITPEKKILSTGSISIPNPYNPDKPSIFRDWKAHGWTDAREAIAVSSDVYYYAIGGGYEDQKGIGIAAIDEYSRKFGFAQPVKDSFFSVKNNGIVPNPEWKAKAFNNDPWRLGDTYTTSIGQFGFLVTPVQAVRALSAIVTKGTLVDPVIVKKGTEGYVPPAKSTITSIEPRYYDIAYEGMRMAVTEGTMRPLEFPDIHVAGKTGTAEVGSRKEFVHSWATGIFPYENPRFAFALVLEKGPSTFSESASVSMRRVFEGMQMSTSTQMYLH